MLKAAIGLFAELSLSGFGFVEVPKGREVKLASDARPLTFDEKEQQVRVVSLEAPKGTMRKRKTTI